MAAGSGAVGNTVRIGIDIGGTFTDYARVSADGLLTSWKTPTSADHIASLGALLDRDRQVLNGSTGELFCHGTTLCTNAALTYGGAATALLITRGFRDVLELKRGHRLASPDQIYDLQQQPPPPYVPRALRLELDERVAADGARVRPIDPGQVRAVARDLAAQGVDAVAISFLFSFRDPANELDAEALVREVLPGAYVSCSARVSPVFREYERTSTTVLNAYLGPLTCRYLCDLEAALAMRGIRTVNRVMTSAGGMVSFDHARARPVDLLRSGPAAGVTAACWLARQHPELRNLITFDMGGTSCDASVIVDGRPAVCDEGEINSFAVSVEMLEILSIGAGGGSLASVDPFGALAVGPQSAGADPGPACYGHGNPRPTVTDANVLLGLIDPGFFLDGRIALDAAAARDAVRQYIAEPLSLATELEGAEAIHRMANANMADAVHTITVARGLDPRKFVLLAYGGCAPLHAVAVARTLGIGIVVVPFGHAVFCALGAAVADDVSSQWRASPGPVTAAEVPRIAALLDELRAACGPFDPNAVYEHTLYLRYEGQAHELPVPADPALLHQGDVHVLLETFHARHAARFGHAAPGVPVAMVKAAVRRSLSRCLPALRTLPGRAESDPLRSVGGRRLRLDGKDMEAAVYRRAHGRPGDCFRGPCVIEGPDSNVLVPDGYLATLDSMGNLWIRED
jgi:N-methylhydantoinase A